MNNPELRAWAEAEYLEKAALVKELPLNKISEKLKRDIVALSTILYRTKEKPGKGPAFAVPRFKHDCKSCIFIGNISGFDFYFHIHSQNIAEIIIRFSSDIGATRTFDAASLSAGLSAL